MVLRGVSFHHPLGFIWHPLEGAGLYSYYKVDGHPLPYKKHQWDPELFRPKTWLHDSFFQVTQIQLGHKGLTFQHEVLTQGTCSGPNLDRWKKSGDFGNL